ncbi:NUDIX hydrolase [Actinokineospora sp.]|uniref:NUDIX hydrolase n=1 Tax=Actinokineospora sp. TaxID=1872133 RepID=UPI003D6A619B
MTRRDYLNDPTAPHANSVAVACSTFVQDADGRVLMIRRTDSGRYTIPGGQLEPGESLSSAAVRETKEETGIDTEISGLVGIYSNPKHVIEYSDGEVRQEFSICFRGNPVGGEIKVSDESEEVGWVRIEQLAELDIHDSIRLRIKHALDGRDSPFYT